jgi:hypothetical protein
MKTFAVTAVERSDHPLVDQRVVQAVAGALSSRGMTRVAHDPDLRVTLNRTSETRKEVTEYSTGSPPCGQWYSSAMFGPTYWGGAGAITSYEVRDLRYDTVAIDMIDVRTGAVAWRGTGTARVHSHWKPKDVDKIVSKSVAKIMSNIPPSSAS